MRGGFTGGQGWGKIDAANLGPVDAGALETTGAQAQPLQIGLPEIAAGKIHVRDVAAFLGVKSERGES